MEKKEYLVEITYHGSGNKEVTTLKTEDLAWSMVQYQRNRLPLTWELLDSKSAEIVDDCCGDNCCDDKHTLEDVEMIQQGIKNHESDNA